MKVKCVGSKDCDNKECLHYDDHRPFLACDEDSICPIINKPTYCREVIKDIELPADLVYV